MLTSFSMSKRKENNGEMRRMRQYYFSCEGIVQCGKQASKQARGQHVIRGRQRYCLHRYGANAPSEHDARSSDGFRV